MTPPARLTLHALILALLAFAAARDVRPSMASLCSDWFMTGYVKGEGSARTADGTSVWTAEPLVAATSLPLGSFVFVPEWATTYRVADTGLLGPNHLDFLVASRAVAFEITGYRLACPQGTP